MKRLVGALFLSAVLVLSGCTCVVKDTPRHGPLTAYQVYEIAMDNNVVLKTNPDNRIFCSGIIAKKSGMTGILTAGHCELPDSNVTIIEGQGMLAVGVFSDRDLEKDLAWLDIALHIATDSPNIPSVARVSPSNIDVGDHVYAIGCPALSVMEQNVFVSGKVSKLEALDGSVNLLDMQVWFGMSGGGVYNDIGELVGLTSSLYRGTSFMLSVTQENIREFLLSEHYDIIQKN